uniref:Seipin-1-like n=1 Tax=Elaeis guineensis var. tenera TaxID=51953 RepID=A0A6I9QJ35_ELAGV|nr:seipin-1-like [Elaeis guineensis]
MARHDENVKTVVILEMEKEIVIKHGDCVWMALYVPSAPLPPIAVATVFVAIGSCALSPSVTAEAIAPNRDTITTFSQPCMLRFKSLPVRLMRTCLMGIPLLMGICTESQKITIEILRYKETSQRTEAIRVRLKPRAGTTDLPQVYAAEIFMNSQLPWGKELVYNWKWTFYVWTSLYMYIILLILWCGWFKPFSLIRHESFVVDQPSEGGEDMADTYKKDDEISDEMSKIIKRWRERRSKRKAPLPEMHLPDLIEGSASSNVRETTEVIEDCSDFEEASESSECGGGYACKSK